LTEHDDMLLVVCYGAAWSSWPALCWL